MDARRCPRLSADAHECGSLNVRLDCELLRIVRIAFGCCPHIVADGYECGSLIVRHWIVNSFGFCLYTAVFVTCDDIQGKLLSSTDADFDIA